MSNLNPNNYQGASAKIVGKAGGAPEFPAYDKDGSRGRKQLRVAVSEGYKGADGNWVDKGTTWYTHNARTEDFPEIGKGDTLVLDDVKLETREFKRKDGSTGQAFETSYGTITVLKKAEGSAIPVSGDFGHDDGDEPF